MKWVFIFTCFVAVLLPTLQMRFDLIPQRRLHGVEVKEKLPDPSVESFLSGKFQDGVDRWFSENIGFRSFFVRTDNQLNFSLFMAISSNYSSPMIVGKNNFLYERLYVDALNQSPRIPVRDLRKIVKSLKLLQTKLGERRKALLVLISPSKAATYPEFIPKHYLKWDGTKTSDYENFIKLLNEYRINFFDGPALMRALKKEGKYPVFAKGATHWSEYASCHVASGIIKNLESALNSSLINIACEPVRESYLASSHDRDLGELLNVWSLKSFSERLGYPESDGIKSEASKRPNALIVGDSFLWTLLRYFDRHRIFRNRAFYYYYKTNYSYPKGTTTAIDRANLDWEEKVFSKDVFIVEINEAAIEQIGFVFIEDALRNLNRLAKL